MNLTFQKLKSCLRISELKQAKKKTICQQRLSQITGLIEKV